MSACTSLGPTWADRFFYQLGVTQERRFTAKECAQAFGKNAPASKVGMTYMFTPFQGINVRGLDHSYGLVGSEYYGVRVQYKTGNNPEVHDLVLLLCPGTGAFGVTSHQLDLMSRFRTDTLSEINSNVLRAIKNGHSTAKFFSR